MPEWPVFTGGQSVAGMKLLDLIDWVWQSSGVLNNEPGPVGMPIVALPPVQRSAVWRPRQVVNLWDSLMRGLPIGTLYLVEQPVGPRNVIRLTANETVEFSGAGFDLLDGQQRVRALLIGAYGFVEEKRCLWVDLGGEGAEQSSRLHLTSKAQPFGYDARTGEKLSVDKRRNARREIEPKNCALRCIGEAGERPAYDLDLFEGCVALYLIKDPVVREGTAITQPPLPFEAHAGQTFQLHELLGAWRGRAQDNEEAGITALRSRTGDLPRSEALKTLHEAFCNVARAEVALLKVNPESFRDRDQDMLTLFERIGAGGTALSGDERLYSIYKYHVPKIRDAVDAIYRRVGRVLPPTKIAATALRVSNARTNVPQYTTPSVVDFAKAMAAVPRSELRQQLDLLIPMNSNDADGGRELLSNSFVAVRTLLSYAEDAGDFWIPDVLLVALPAELWQVLVFWAVSYPEPADLKLCREEAVRFALFWYLFVWNNERAASWAFQYIKLNKSGRMNFPGAALYRRFIGTIAGDSCAYALVPAQEYQERICKKEDPVWRTDAERFFVNGVANPFDAKWWWDGRKLLPWLQRDYVRRAFPGYAPLTDHEDDVPYDFDHICPYGDLGDWVSIRRRFLKNKDVELRTQQRMRDGRNAIGNGVGNIRLVEASTNRSDQDADVSKKFNWAPNCQPELDEQDALDFAFPSAREHLALWKRVSCPNTTNMSDRLWTNDRLAAFQKAVEQRAAWLYSRFHDDLHFGKWISAQPHDGAPALEDFSVDGGQDSHETGA